MSRSINTALRRLRQDLRHHLGQDDVAQVCRQHGHLWRRDAELTPFAILLRLLDQVLHGNTALQHLSLKARRSFTASALCQARARLPLAVFRGVLRRVVPSMLPATEAEGHWRGHRTFFIDGSSFSMPDGPELRQHFGYPPGQRPGCGFPVAKILALFHAGTGLLLDVIAVPWRAHEMGRVGAIHPNLRAGDVLIGDRAFCSYVHLAMLRARGIHAVVRAHQRQIIDFTPNRPHADPGRAKGASGLPRSRWVGSSGRWDQEVEWLKPAAGPRWLDAAAFAGLPGSIAVRELRYEVNRPGFRSRVVTLVTTLVDPAAYPSGSLAELYGMRWRVEGHLRELKQTMGMDVLRCRGVEGIEKELLVYGLVYNLVRLAMVGAANRQGVPVCRISFVDALRWLRLAEVGEEAPRLVVNPERTGRCEPRVRKRRPKSYPLMTKPRSESRKAMAEQPLAAQA